ncbi:MAG: hypothetical protein IRY98_00885 [Alicyclobacillaceae bacterium]|nr:hypothetical protein [Alicyclobacillaceae bacterium]
MGKQRSQLGSRRMLDPDPVLQADYVNTEAEVVEARTAPEATSTTVVPVPVVGPVTIKVPVVLAQLNVQIDIDAMIRLPEPALEIKRIDKRVYLEQCDLVLPTNRLFLRGYVRKDIEYATLSRVTRRSISGDIRHTAVNVPFECVTPVTFLTPPVEPTPEQYEEYPVLTGRFGRSLREQDSVTIYHFDAKPYCELVSATIVEADLERHVRDLKGTLPTEGSFRTFREQMTVFLTLQILQRQLVLDPAPATTPTPTPTPAI